MSTQMGQTQEGPTISGLGLPISHYLTDMKKDCKHLQTRINHNIMSQFYLIGPLETSLYLGLLGDIFVNLIVPHCVRPKCLHF